MTKKTETIAKESKKSGGPNEPITLAIATRLFAQDGYAFRDAFRALVRKFSARHSSRSIFAKIQMVRPGTSIIGSRSKCAIEFAI
jgi:hypothetical protein